MIKLTDEMLQAATDEYDEWANENKGTTECIRAMLAKALKASPQISSVQEPIGHVGVIKGEYVGVITGEVGLDDKLYVCQSAEQMSLGLENAKLTEQRDALFVALTAMVDHVKWREGIQGCLGTFEEIMPAAEAAIAKVKTEV